MIYGIEPHSFAPIHPRANRSPPAMGCVATSPTWTGLSGAILVIERASRLAVAVVPLMQCRFVEITERAQHRFQLNDLGGVRIQAEAVVALHRVSV